MAAFGAIKHRASLVLGVTEMIIYMSLYRFQEVRRILEFID
jgi:hypothetical protein